MCLGVEEWLNFFKTLVRITIRIGPAINFLFHFLQYMILPVYCSMMLVYLLSCRREMVKQRWNVGGNIEEACTTLAW